MNILGAKRHKHSIFHQTYATKDRTFPVAEGSQLPCDHQGYGHNVHLPKSGCLHWAPSEVLSCLFQFPTCDGPTKQQKNMRQKCFPKNGTPKSLKHLHWHTAI